MSKKQHHYDFYERLKLIKKSGLTGKKPILNDITNFDELTPIPERIDQILSIVKKLKKLKICYTLLCMIFIMYDIENNKIRNYIAKYLLKKGCIRIQKSIFLASNDRKTFSEFSETLKEVNEIYENNDSILIIPVSTDELRSMRLIGKEIDLNFTTDKPNTLFF